MFATITTLDSIASFKERSDLINCDPEELGFRKMVFENQNVLCWEDWSLRYPSAMASANIAENEMGVELQMRLYELPSPILSCEKTSFADEEIFKLKEIFYRQDDQEVYLNLYAVSSQLPDGLKEGSDVMGIVRLYAEPIAEAIN